MEGLYRKTFVSFLTFVNPKDVTVGNSMYMISFARPFCREHSAIAAKYGGLPSMHHPEIAQKMIEMSSALASYGPQTHTLSVFAVKLGLHRFCRKPGLQRFLWESWVYNGFLRESVVYNRFCGKAGFTTGFCGKV